MSLDYRMIGKRIKKRREQENLTQEKLAEACDVSEQYISNIERSVSIPSVEVVMRIADALNTTPDEFLVGSAHFHDEAWRNVAEKLRGLNKEQLNIADKMIDFIAENL